VHAAVSKTRLNDDDAKDDLRGENRFIFPVPSRLAERDVAQVAL